MQNHFFTPRRRGRSQAAYEPQTAAEWAEENRLIAEAEAQRREKKTTTDLPPGGPPKGDAK